VEDTVATHSFSEFTPVTFSPDGQRLSYTARDNRKIAANSPERYPLSGVTLNAFGADVFLIEVMTGAVTNLTGGTGNNWLPTWSPDGRHLAFLSDRDGSGQAKLWVWEAVTGKMRKASDVFVRANQIQWLPNNREVMLTVLPANLTPEQFAQRVLGPPAREGSFERVDKVHGSTVMVYQSAATTRQGSNDSGAGAWNLNGWLRDLIVIDVDSGKTQIVDQGHRIATYALSPNGSDVAVTIPTRFEEAGSQQILFNLDVIALASHSFQVLASDIRLRFDGSTFSWSPDSSRLVFQTGGIEAAGDCYLVGLQHSIPKNITNLESPTTTGTSTPFWDADGRHIYFLHSNEIWFTSPERDKASFLAKIQGHHIIELVTRKGVVFSLADRSLVLLVHDDESKESGFYKVDQKTGEAGKLLQETKSYAAWQDRAVTVSSDGNLLAFFSQDAQHPQELWLTSPDFRNARRLTHINPRLDKYQFGATRLTAWQSLDGEKLQGALLLPAGDEQARTYPLIVCVYGGESLSNSVVQFGLDCAGMNMQLFATRGYAVLLPESPQHLGTPMLDLAKTVLPGVDKVVEMGIADPNRLGLMGHSYGGYSTLSLLVQTKRFKAAMSADGFSDITASYGQMNKDGSAFGQSVAEAGQELMGGPPWQFPQRYLENSPVFYLDRVETPVLIVHGAADTTVLPFLSDETFVDLRRLGKEAMYAKYEGEEHSPLYWSYANQLDFCNRVIAWFDKYLKPASPPN
jgi:dipeptidyl aminopeptidase/acylaminoacyl peptidase